MGADYCCNFEINLNIRIILHPTQVSYCALQVQVRTGEDVLAPPQQVSATVSNLTMTILWLPPCPFSAKYPSVDQVQGVHKVSCGCFN